MRASAARRRLHRLNDEIQAAAYDAYGYVGQESWVSPGRHGAQRRLLLELTMAGLREFADLAAHRAAKPEFRRWYLGYHIVIAQIHSRHLGRSWERVSQPADAMLTHRPQQARMNRTTRAPLPRLGD